MAVIAGLGFASGLPLYLTAQTLGAWMAVAGADLTTIGAFALVGLPYTFKWTWAPLLDRVRLPWLGRRRGWLVPLQLALAAAIAAMGATSPTGEPARLAALAALVAFLSATQDVVADAYVAEALPPAERAAGATVYVVGYRVGILFSGTLALVLAERWPWRDVYLACAGAMAVGVAAARAAVEPEPGPPLPLGRTVARALGLLLRARGAAVVLAFVALYRFGEHLAQTLLAPYLVTRVGFSLTEIATLNQALALFGLIVGGAVAGALVPRLGVRRTLVGFGALMAATNLGYAALLATGPSPWVLGAAVLCDNLANAMGIAAFLAYLMSRCDRSVTATQYALLTSLSSIGGRVFGFTAGPIVEALGWAGFFGVTAALAVPALLLARFLPGMHDRNVHETGGLRVDS
jgi:PAT family beta-lactamase induction signal transducer AmpG